MPHILFVADQHFIAVSADARIFYPFGVIIDSHNGRLGFDLEARRQAAAVVIEIVPTSAASRAGLELGDHIISVNSDHLQNMSPDLVTIHLEEATRSRPAILHIQRLSKGFDQLY